jgi:hypothetical protein
METRSSLQTAFRILLAGLASGLVIGVLVALFGWVSGWKAAVEFSNGMFVTGSAIIVFGILSMWGGFTSRGNFAQTYAQTASDMSLPERAKLIYLDVLRGYNVVITCTIIGVVLIGLSVLTFNLFG